MNILLKASCRLFQKLWHLAWTKRKDQTRLPLQEQQVEMKKKDIRPRQIVAEFTAIENHVVMPKDIFKETLFQSI